MSNIMIRISLAIVVLFSVVAIGGRTAQSTPDAKASLAAVDQQAAPADKTPGEGKQPVKSLDDLLPDRDAEKMSCTVHPGPNDCAHICAAAHKCEGLCSPHGGCVCRQPPCL